MESADTITKNYPVLQLARPSLPTRVLVRGLFPPSLHTCGTHPRPRPHASTTLQTNITNYASSSICLAAKGCLPTSPQKQAPSSHHHLLLLLLHPRPPATPRPACLPQGPRAPRSLHDLKHPPKHQKSRIKKDTSPPTTPAENQHKLHPLTSDRSRRLTLAPFLGDFAYCGFATISAICGVWVYG